MSDTTNTEVTETLDHNEIQVEKFVSFEDHSDYHDNKPKKKRFIFMCCIPKEKNDYEYTKNS